MIDNASNTGTTTDELSPQQFSLIDRLKCFNAKERYWAVRQALGHFHPTEQFVRDAAKAAGVMPPTESAHSAIYLAMDYHLNWLHAAFSDLPIWAGPESLAERNKNRSTTPSITSSTQDRIRDVVENSIEDVDLLLAYQTGRGPSSRTQLILIEAKCAGQFTFEQIESKFRRLALITNSARVATLRQNPFDLKFILMSPHPLSKALRDSIKDDRSLDDNEFAIRVASGDSHLKMEIRPLDKRGFWKVRPRDVSDAATATSTRRSPDGKRLNKSTGWTHWTMSIRPGTADNSGEN